jgi:hypothetical protein
MPDCFISYASCDQPLANYVHHQLGLQGISAFMASISLQPGDHWSASVRQNLAGSKWVILLASREACASPWVQQEIGMALCGSKRLVSIVWEFPPNELPGWAAESQAIDLRGKTVAELHDRIGAIATSIKQSQQQGLVILGAVLLGLWAFSK